MHGRAADALSTTARLAQSAERKALNLVVVGSSPTVGALSYSVQLDWVFNHRSAQGIAVCVRGRAAEPAARGRGKYWSNPSGHSERYRAHVGWKYN